MNDAWRSWARIRRVLQASGVLLALCFGGIGRAQQSLITLNVRNEGLGDLLEALSVQHRLNLVFSEQVSGDVSINLYDVPLDEALAQILATRGLGFVREGAFHRILTLEERRKWLDERDGVEARVFTLSHLTSNEVQQLLTPLLSPEGTLSLSGAAGGQGAGGFGGGAGGGGQVVSSGHRESIVVQDRTSRLEVIASTLAQLDRPPQQVLLEATILSVDLGEDNRLGVDFNVLGGVDFQQVGAGSDLTGVTGYDATGLLNEGIISGQTFGFANSPPGQGLSLGFLKNNVAVFVEALEQTTSTTIVSNPRVLALNGQQAEIIVGGRLGYTTATTTQLTAIEQVQFLDTGTQLVFTPFIGDDGWIRMRVHPANSSGVIDPVSGIPSETTTEISTNILMRDGQTLVLGGLISERVSTIRSQVPILGNIPLIGWMFGRTQEVVDREELVILLTPHIIDPVEAQGRAEDARQRFEATRRSHWETLSPYIRPVLARNHYADAEVQRARGRTVSALGSVERALALDPTNPGAAVLRQQLVEELALERLGPDDPAHDLEVLRAIGDQNGAERPEGGR